LGDGVAGLSHCTRVFLGCQHDNKIDVKRRLTLNLRHDRASSLLANISVELGLAVIATVDLCLK